MRRIIDWIVTDNDVVLDFFGGSGTTAHAVYQSNAELSRSNKFILVQIPEPTPDKDYENLAELTKRRIKKSAEEIANAFEKSKVDFGFRVLRIDTSNMADVYYTPSEVKQDNLLYAIDNIKTERDNPEDLLFQVLVDWGVDLTLPIRSETDTGQDSVLRK